MANNIRASTWCPRAETHDLTYETFWCGVHFPKCQGTRTMSEVRQLESWMHRGCFFFLGEREGGALSLPSFVVELSGRVDWNTLMALFFSWSCWACRCPSKVKSLQGLFGAYRVASKLWALCALGPLFSLWFRHFLRKQMWFSLKSSIYVRRREAQNRKRFMSVLGTF